MASPLQPVRAWCKPHPRDWLKGAGPDSAGPAPGLMRSETPLRSYNLTDRSGHILGQPVRRLAVGLALSDGSPIPKICNTVSPDLRATPRLVTHWSLPQARWPAGVECEGAL